MKNENRILGTKMLLIFTRGKIQNFQFWKSDLQPRIFYDGSKQVDFINKISATSFKADGSM